MVLYRVHESAAGGEAKGRDGRLRRMSIKLIVLAVVEILAVVGLTVAGFLPPSVFNSLSLYYGVGFSFPLLIFLLYLVVLCVFFRFAKWQVKLTENAETATHSYVSLDG